MSGPGSREGWRSLTRDTDASHSGPNSSARPPSAPKSRGFSRATGGAGLVKPHVVGRRDAISIHIQTGQQCLIPPRRTLLFTIPPSSSLHSSTYARIHTLILTLTLTLLLRRCYCSHYILSVPACARTWSPPPATYIHSSVRSFCAHFFASARVFLSRDRLVRQVSSDKFCVSFSLLIQYMVPPRSIHPIMSICMCLCTRIDAQQKFPQVDVAQHAPRYPGDMV